MPFIINIKEASYNSPIKVSKNLLMFVIILIKAVEALMLLVCEILDRALSKNLNRTIEFYPDRISGVGVNFSKEHSVSLCSA